MNKIQIFTTKELSEDLWTQIVDGFNASFEGHHTDKKHLQSGYTSNSFGGSYHALCFDGNKLIGFNTIVPNYYSPNLILGLSGTTFVLKEYRKDIFIFSDIFNALKAHCLELGITAFLGVPNQNSYQYSLKLLRSSEVGLLSYYVLPLKIAAIVKRPRLKILNLFSLFYSYVIILINVIVLLFWNAKERIVKYRLRIDDDFFAYRFKDNHYKVITDVAIRSFYTIATEDGVAVAYIMDFREEGVKSSCALLKTLRYIMKHEHVDAIMYVGTMNLRQYLLAKVPHRFDPKPLHYTYNLTDKKLKDEFVDMADLKNWDFSLMNLDVR